MAREGFWKPVERFWKFDVLWQVVDNMCAELLKEQDSTSSRRRFTQWIKYAPKEKWSILYDTGGRRYGIETTNHAECYNMVMRHVRGFPLVGIVEFIMYGCTR